MKKAVEEDQLAVVYVLEVMIRWVERQKIKNGGRTKKKQSGDEEKEKAQGMKKSRSGDTT